MRPSKLSLSILSALILAGCGGGGASGSVDAAITPVTNGTSLALSADNFEAAGVEALGAGLFVGSKVLGFAWTQVQTLPARFTNLTKSIDTACGTSGTVKSTVVDANGNGVAEAGDQLVLVYSACVSNGITRSGTLKMTVNAPLVGTLGSSSYSADVTFSFVSYTEAGSSQSSQAQGTLRLVRTQTSATDGQAVISTTGGTDGFIAGVAAGGSTQTRAFTGFTSTITSTAAATDASLSGTLTSSSLGGKSLVLSTPTPLRTLSGATIPSSGSFVAAGAGTGTVTLTAGASATQVGVKLDLNADGQYENTVLHDWVTVQ